MISAQRDALEAARKSREDALKATKVRLSILSISLPELIWLIRPDQKQFFGFHEPRVAHAFQFILRPS